MLYKQNQKAELDPELFKNPTSEYRAAPFWAWNCELDEQELLWQIEQLKAMGFGGFHMHTRSGMATRYLSDEFMRLIKSCTQRAKDEHMLAWLYDEDRWPSGAAGGFVTKSPEFRQRRLFFTTQKWDDVQPKEAAIKHGATYLLGTYDIVLNERGELSEYRLLKDGDAPRGAVRYAYIQVFSSFLKSAGWYNGETYVDTLNKRAIERFVELTHQRYKETVGEYFGSTVPAIFTDEPQFSHKVNLPFAKSTRDAILPWTPDFDESFLETYGYDIKDKLPELFWDNEDGKPSVARYHFHDHACERFTEAFADTCGRWCEQNSIALTGHMYGETSLSSQTKSIGEAMRAYRSFGLPGIDILFNNTEYGTAKQAQSAAHQYGREGVASELYGVTNWDFDFRGHKQQGDWQAALGVTVRVPHLSWVCMKGSAKRDYPATINYQSPWYREYSLIEDHFARLNTVLTRGRPCVNVAVIHPIESCWLNFGPAQSTLSIREQLNENFDNIIKWLLFDTIDFDLVCESTLPSLCGDIGKRLTVGEMSYSAVVVPACLTLRGTTADILERFMERGGKVIFAGDAPKYIDAVPSDRARRLYESAIRVPFTRHEIVEALCDQRQIDIKDHLGRTPRQFIYQLRQDGEHYRLFIANARPTIDHLHNGTQPPTRATITIKGEYAVSVLNTNTGEAEPIEHSTQDGCTAVHYDFYEHDSLLLSLKSGKSSYRAPARKRQVLGSVDFKRKVRYTRHEDNVCLLDLAEFSLDGSPFEPCEEILRIDKRLREKFDWPLATGQDMQPWAMEKEEVTHFVELRFTVNCEQALKNVCLCAEELVGMELNGETVGLETVGYFVDKSIKKYALPHLAEGENTVTVTVPFSKSESLEACFLVGDFNVVLEGCERTLRAASETVGFGDITSQGMPFYGGNITYTAKINVPTDCDLCVNIANYRGALTKVALDGKEAGSIVFAPYELEIKDISAGEHTLEFTLFGNRHNTFGGLHNCGQSIYYGQGYWYSVDNAWCYEYNTKPTGILKSPVITMYKKD